MRVSRRNFSRATCKAQLRKLTVSLSEPKRKKKHDRLRLYRRRSQEPEANPKIAEMINTWERPLRFLIGKNMVMVIWKGTGQTAQCWLIARRSTLCFKSQPRRASSHSRLTMSSLFSIFKTIDFNSRFTDEFQQSCKPQYLAEATARTAQVRTMNRVVARFTSSAPTGKPASATATATSTAKRDPLLRSG